MKKSMIFLSLGAILGCIFCSIFIINVLAESNESRIISYYTYIQIQPGDTLWSIAKTYTQGTDMTVEDYVQRLKQMNHIGEDAIHVGHYLTIMYQKPEERAVVEKSD